MALANPEVRKQRWDICNACEHITNMRRCDKCKCVLKLKILFDRMKCPIGKWDSA